MQNAAISDTSAIGIKNRRPLLAAPKGSWPWAVAFLLSMSALGLLFYPALIVIFFILVNRYRNDRYHFVIQITILLGGYALIEPSVTGYNMAYLAFALGVACMLLLRKTGIFKKAVVAWVACSAVFFILAILSEEPVMKQYGSLICYCTFIYFTVPVATFAGKEFDYDRFVRTLLPYALTLCIFYILDAFVLSGWVLIPRSHVPGGGFTAFYDLGWAPLSGAVIRKYPPGLYILTLLLYPLARRYRLPLWQWGVILLGMLSTQTFTFISGLLIVYVLLQATWKRIILYVVLGTAGSVALYFIDGSMAYTNDELRQESPLRIYTSVNQILDLTEAMDDEDLAEFGSGRIGQAIPKLELLYNLGYQWKGLGFLSENTDNPKFIVENDYYLDQSEAIEVATGIEITALQALITIGYIGLAAHILFFAYLVRIVFRCRYRGYFISVICAFLWFGLGGFEGLIFPMGLELSGLAFAVVLLSNKTQPSAPADAGK
ncbi:MAG: hypothetical protein K2G07_03035 [Muribaculaceae bacterium]|nr:hypothetical protein [Muribaculaceae bacterium]